MMIKNKNFRVHGDNIVECERIVDYLLHDVKVISQKRAFSSLACMHIEVSFEFLSKIHCWKIELFPGFNKSNRLRWKADIFTALRENGSFLDETPDAIVTVLEENGLEKILYAVEFCSALQAGNQAWQRSGRAYSVGRAGCPYLYIVDFVRYELDTRTRERKALRFPNAAVSYSYISFTKHTGTFIAQAYVKSEEFQPAFDKKIEGFDNEIFANIALSEYMLLMMLGEDTSKIEEVLLDKNAKMVEWLSKENNTDSSFCSKDWHTIYETKATTITHALDTRRFKFQKSIAEKSIFGKSRELSSLVTSLSIGMGSKDLPFGIIPPENRVKFAQGISKLYEVDKDTINKISFNREPLIVCMVKGFKPAGDDNRPDRGILPLVAMLSSETAEIFTYIYGPLSNSNYKMLCNTPDKLANKNGFWRVFMSLSNYIALDVPLLNAEQDGAEKVIDNTKIKSTYINQRQINDFSRTPISVVPNSFHEDDVDTVIHTIFKHLITDGCFEGMCNPPGGDWSGLSIVFEGNEYRWLSLPRVSTDCKRPDHVIELFGLNKKPILLIIESKDRKKDLENGVGDHLKGYVDYLLSYTPSAKRDKNGWTIADAKISREDFGVVSAGAYISKDSEFPADVFERSKCDMIFALYPNIGQGKWDIRIFANSDLGNTIKSHIESCLMKVASGIMKVIT